jgi:nicotinate-nucleotide adenylyltransferase
MIGIFGGTFDPIHYGHLRSALELSTEQRLSQVRLVPSATPPHRRGPLASAADRLRMVELAVSEMAGWVADSCELARQGPSYSVDTLTEQQCHGEPLALCLGMDAFLGLPTWHRWQEIPTLATLIVAHRPGWAWQGQVAELVPLVAAGGVIFQAVTPLDISASTIRQLIARGGDPRFLLPDAVRAYILQQSLYR